MSRARILTRFAIARWGRRFRDRRALERYQARRVRRQLAFLRRRSPAFRDAPDALGDLPLMDKRSMMSRFDELVTVPVRRDEAMAVALDAERRRDFDATLGGIAVGLSSGTSGHRGLFLTSAAERDAWAGTALAVALPRGRLLGHRIALVLRAGNRLYDTVRSRAVAFAWFDLYDDVPRIAEGLERFRPTILVAPPSALRALAAAHPRISPDRVYAVAEVLGDADADAIATAFRVPLVHQLYQCTEGLLARTCDRGTLHLAEDLVLVEREPIDEHRFVPIVTDLHRRSQPIVRYRLDDVLVTRSEPCPCGSVLAPLERIEGREDDVLRIDGRPVFADLVTRAMIHATGFGEYRVTQTAPDRIEVQLDDLEGEASARTELDALWRRLGVRAPTTTFHPYERDLARKTRRVQRRGTG